LKQLFVAAMNSSELKLLTFYLPFSLNIDEAAFRRQLVTSVHTILTRLRDFSLLQLRQNAAGKTSSVDISEAFGQWNCCGVGFTCCMYVCVMKDYK